MSGFCGLGYRVVWCPICRCLVLPGAIADRCKELIRAKAAGRGWRMVAREIMPDHGHVSMKAHRV
jgi:putative transposase